MNVLDHPLEHQKNSIMKRKNNKALKLFVEWIAQILFSHLKFLSYLLQDASSSNIIMMIN